MDLIEEGFKLFGSMAAVNFIPVMRYLPCLQKVRNKLAENRAEMAGFFQETVDQHRATFDEGTMRDLVDAYLLEIEKAKGEGRATTLFQGKNHGELAMRLAIFPHLSSFFLFIFFFKFYRSRSSDATDTRRLVLRRDGNCEDHVRMGDNLDAASSGRGDRCTGGIGSSGREIEDASLGGSPFPSDNRSNDTRGPQTIERRPFGDHSCYDEVRSSPIYNRESFRTRLFSNIVERVRIPIDNLMIQRDLDLEALALIPPIRWIRWNARHVDSII